MRGNHKLLPTASIEYYKELDKYDEIGKELAHVRMNAGLPLLWRASFSIKDTLDEEL